VALGLGHSDTTECPEWRMSMEASVLKLTEGKGESS